VTNSAISLILYEMKKTVGVLKPTEGTTGRLGLGTLQGFHSDSKISSVLLLPLKKYFYFLWLTQFKRLGFIFKSNNLTTLYVV
jgi:hypothetical protein